MKSHYVVCYIAGTQFLVYIFLFCIINEFSQSISFCVYLLVVYSRNSDCIFQNIDEASQWE